MAHNFFILNFIDNNVTRMIRKHIIATIWHFEVPLKLKVWNLNYGNEIVLYEIHQFPNRVPK
jgi:hypothetical protein